jgi:hypothetical protein
MRSGRGLGKGLASASGSMLAPLAVARWARQRHPRHNTLPPTGLTVMAAGGNTMSSVSSLLDHHVTLRLSCVDRIICQGYVAGSPSRLPHGRAEESDNPSNDEAPIGTADQVHKDHGLSKQHGLHRWSSSGFHGATPCVTVVIQEGDLVGVDQYEGAGEQHQGRCRGSGS